MAIASLTEVAYDGGEDFGGQDDPEDSKIGTRAVSPARRRKRSSPSTVPPARRPWMTHGNARNRVAAGPVDHLKRNLKLCARRALPDRRRPNDRCEIPNKTDTTGDRHDLRLRFSATGPGFDSPYRYKSPSCKRSLTSRTTAYSEIEVGSVGALHCARPQACRTIHVRATEGSPKCLAGG